ncbi:hypothetical protein SAMN05216323_10626 [Williamwhitmania taraxaci]|uniref:Uncharacterized protein n=1 Tax=Williamwhitmania taraxaci TaxID=1640674 RepID=A0A1G6QL85_9BACT|nr:hypothetical protein SAMN05216323_10626 [Williamwhitmania taraxaci]
MILSMHKVVKIAIGTLLLSRKLSMDDYVDLSNT